MDQKSGEMRFVLGYTQYPQKNKKRKDKTGDKLKKKTIVVPVKAD